MIYSKRNNKYCKMKVGKDRRSIASKRRKRRKDMGNEK